MKFKSKPLGKVLYGVAAFNGIITQYWGDSYKDAEDTFYKSHTATHLYKMVGAVKEIIKVAQLVEQMPCKHPVADSISVASTKQYVAYRTVTSRLMKRSLVRVQPGDVSPW